MSVLALITDPTEIRPIVITALCSARAYTTDIRVLCYEYAPVSESAETVAQREEAETVIGRVTEVFDEFGRAFPGEPSVDPSQVVRVVRHPDPVAATLAQVRKGHIELVVAGADSVTTGPSKRSLQSQLLRHIPCNLSLVSTRGERTLIPTRVAAIATDSPDDRSLVAGAYRMAAANEGSLTVMTIESATGSHAIELGERELQDVLKGAGVAKKRDIETRVLQADNQLEAIVSVAGQFDIVAVGANNLKHFSRLADSIAQATIVIFRKAAPIRPWRSRNRLIDLVPRLAPSDYADLVQNLRTGSRWSTDFRIMLGLAVGIASLGLLLNSAAVIIGSMLLAPLMTPMVGAGLSLVQGNARLAGTCARSVGRGVLMGVAISFLIGLALPGDELTPELTARGSPNVLDLLIALFSAAAGAYALARPTLAGSIAGVAIATALVPPLCTVGISLSAGQFDNAVGAALLFITNLFAIVLAAAGMFRWMGLGESVDPVQHSKWVRRVSVAMLLATIALTIPLSEGLIHRLRKGVSQTAAAPLSASTYEAVQQHIDRSPGVSIVLAVRRPSSLERQTDYRIVVASDDPLPRSFAAAITRIIRTQMKDDSLRVEVISLPQNWMADDE